MKRMDKFYNWYTEKIKAIHYITDEQFINIQNKYYEET